MTLNRKYNEAMNGITLSDEAKNRILEGVMKADLTPVKKRNGFRYWKQLMAFSFVFIFGIALFPLLNTQRNDSMESAPAIAEETTAEGVYAMDNDAADAGYLTLSDLESVCGYEIKEPAVPFAVTETEYMYQAPDVCITYYGEENTLVYRISEPMAELNEEKSETPAESYHAAARENSSGSYSFTNEEGRYITLEISGSTQQPDWQMITAPLTEQ